MTLDEAIRHAEEVAEDAKIFAMMEGFTPTVSQDLNKCADEHRQLAEWLRELKRLRESATDTDAISRQAAIYVASGYCHPANIADELRKLPSAQPEIKPIEYRDCANAMLRMWIDNVVTDGEYNRIMDKLNAHWEMGEENGKGENDEQIN